MRLKRVVFICMLLLSLTVVAQAAYNESPMLQEKVKAGELPPVEERLPENPAVVAAVTEDGQYGGTMQFGFTGNNPGWGGLWFVTGWENLTIWKPDFSGIAPNIAESWVVENDAKEFTFQLRKGLKWSDGAPFTADDILFYVEDIMLDEDLSPSGPVADWLPPDMADGFKVEKLGEYSVKFSFPKSYGLFLYNLATWSGRQVAFFPKHYLKQFHKKYNPDIDALVAETDGVEEWTVLFVQKAAGPSGDHQHYYNLPERPVLYPWIVTKALGADTTIEMARNPYYFKVDQQGNQLPYIDKITGTSFQDGESRTFAMLNGDLDFVKDPGAENRILYHEAMDEGKPIQMRYIFGDGGNTLSIHFNQSVEDPLKAGVFADKNFRIGMSHAINREEMIEIVYNGQGVPAQVAPLESSPLYNERLATQYIDYDVALANEYLDKVLPDKDSEGFRLGADGKRFSIVLSVSNSLSYGSTWVQQAELLTQYWAEVGVEVMLNAMHDEQFVENKKANQLEATVYTGEGGAGLIPILDPRYYVPMEYFGMFGNAWRAWNINSTDSVQVEPSQEIKDIRLKFENEVLAAPTEEGQIAAMKEVLELTADQFWVIGIARPGNGYQPLNTRLGNVPETWVSGWIEGVQKITYPEQWYLMQ